MNKITALSLAAALAAVSTSAFAADGAGAFVRGEIGSTDGQLNGTSQNDTAYAIRGGYNVNEYFGVEAFYGDYYGKNLLSLDLEAKGYGVGLVGKYRFGDDKGFFIDGRAGFARTTLSADGFDFEKTVPYAGLGVGYDINNNYGITLNYVRQNAIKPAPALKVELETLSLGFEYRF